MPQRLVVSMVVAVDVECGFEFNVAIGTKTQNGPVCDVADKKKAKKNYKALFAYVFSS